jgi:predicted SnoaL-like aldol condensation-catalyzing enzyme
MISADLEWKNPAFEEAIVMDTEKNKKVVRDFYEEVFHKHNLAIVGRFMHDDYIQHNPDAAQGKTGFIDFHKGFFAAIPDHCATINEIVAEGNLAYVYNTITGTHTGEGFLGFPPTGNKVKYDVVDMFRLRDGKLCEHWDVADTRALFSQVGAIAEIRKKV